MSLGTLYTGPDSVRAYYTNATSNGTAQTDPDLSASAYVSSTEATFLAVELLTSGLTNITINYVSGANGPGTGTITAVDANTLTWTAPGGAAGAPVEITNGQSKILMDLNNPAAYVRVSRTSATALSGSLSVGLSDQFGNVIGATPISDAERSAGVNRYRNVAYQNEHVGTGVKILDHSFWLEPPDYTPTALTLTAVLASSGAGTLSSAGEFTSWPASGWALITTAAGAVREMIYYTSRTNNNLTVPSAGRAIGGTSAAAGATSDVVRVWHGRSLKVQTGTPFASDPTSLTGWTAAYSEATAVAGPTSQDTGIANSVACWVRLHVPAGAVGTVVIPTTRINHQFSTIQT